MSNKYKYVLGIDPGKCTGYALWNTESKSFAVVASYPIHKAMFLIRDFYAFEPSLFVRVEDARKRKWYGDAGREKLQGVGSVKRDSSILEDFLKDLLIPHEMVAPKNNKTKLTSEAFRKLTRWEFSTNQHGRDAAGLSFGF